MRMFSIREDVAQAIANYLQERPFREVANLISAISTLQAIPDVAESTESLPTEKDTNEVETNE